MVDPIESDMIAPGATNAIEAARRQRERRRRQQEAERDAEDDGDGLTDDDVTVNVDDRDLRAERASIPEVSDSESSEPTTTTERIDQARERFFGDDDTSTDQSQNQSQQINTADDVDRLARQAGLDPAQLDDVEMQEFDTTVQSQGAGTRSTAPPSAKPSAGDIARNPGQFKQDIGDDIINNDFEANVGRIRDVVAGAGRAAGGFVGDKAGDVAEVGLDVAGQDTAGDVVDSATEKVGRGAGEVVAAPVDLVTAGVEGVETGGALAREATEGDVEGFQETFQATANQAPVLVGEAKQSAEAKPLETSGTILAGVAGGAAASRVASSARLSSRAITPRGKGRRSVSQFIDDESAQLEFRQQGAPEIDSDGAGAGSQLDDGGSRATTTQSTDELLSGSPRDQISGDITSRAKAQRQQASGTVEDPFESVDATVGRGPAGDVGTGGSGTLLREADIPTQTQRGRASTPESSTVVDDAVGRLERAETPSLDLVTGLDARGAAVGGAVGSAAASDTAGVLGFDAAATELQAEQGRATTSGVTGDRVGTGADSSLFDGAALRPDSDVLPDSTVDAPPTVGSRSDTGARTDTAARTGTATDVLEQDMAMVEESTPTEPSPTSPSSVGRPRDADPTPRPSRPRTPDPPELDLDGFEEDEEELLAFDTDEEVFSSGIQSAEDIIQDLQGDGRGL